MNHRWYCTLVVLLGNVLAVTHKGVKFSCAFKLGELSNVPNRQSRRFIEILTPNPGLLYRVYVYTDSANLALFEANADSKFARKSVLRNRRVTDSRNQKCHADAT